MRKLQMNKLRIFMLNASRYPRFLITTILSFFAILAIQLFGGLSAGKNDKKTEPFILIENPVASNLSNYYLSGYSRDTSKLNQYNFNLIQVPQYCDSTYKSRLKQIEASIPLTYNKEVKGFMNLYLIKKRALVTRIIGRSYDYYPLFEAKLKEKGMPDELKHLAIVESALNPDAKSWAGAYGLWQFIPSTARLYKLRVDDEVDERLSAELSTEAALNFLSDLHRKYNDWHLAIAAYNCGPGNVNKAIKKALAAGKKKDFWSIKPYLPKETQSYVPAFIAACYMMNHFHAHNLKAIDPQWHSVDWIEVSITDNLVLEELATALKLSPEEISCFNPSLEKSKNLIGKDKDICLNLPITLHHVFYASEEEIYNKSNFIINGQLLKK
jgi:membrane-bound lytic murein transglycosylase D